MKHLFASATLLLAFACGFTPAYAAKDKADKKAKKEKKAKDKDKKDKDKKDKDKDEDEGAIDKRQYAKILKEIKPLMGSIKATGKFFMYVGVNTLTEDGENRIKTLLEIQNELKKARVSLVVVDFTADDDDNIIKAYKKLKAKLPVITPKQLRVKHPEEQDMTFNIAPNAKEIDVSICDATGKPIVVSNGSLLEGWHKYVGAKPAPPKKKKEAEEEEED